MLGPDEAVPVLDAKGALGSFAVSSVSRRGVPELLEALWKASRAILAEERKGDDEEWWTP
jgi:hypothetical protein